MIRLPSEVYKRLEKHATGFDTPLNVIVKLLDMVEGVESGPAATAPDLEFAERDFTKYVFEGRKLGKSRLVLAVVTSFVRANDSVTFSELLAVFPRGLQGSGGVFETIEDAQEIAERTKHKRHYIKPYERLVLSDCVIAVSTQWGAGNIDNFIDVARKIGFKISEA
jgi:hypothetical protein